jgi:beta-galactosidase
VLGEYKSDFYAGMPSVTVNSFGNGKAYYAAFRNDADFADDFCKMLIEENSITPDCDITADDGIEIRKRGDMIFVLNFCDDEKKIVLDREYLNVVSGEKMSGEIMLGSCKYLILE